MLKAMFVHSKPQFFLAVIFLLFGLFLLLSGRGAAEFIWGGNVGFIFLFASGLWFVGSWMVARRVLEGREG
jgi:hypothetical protein